MEKFTKNLRKIGVSTSIIGLGLLLFVIFFDIKAPNPAFSVLVGLGVGLIFLSALFYILAYLRDLKKSYRDKNKSVFITLLVTGLVFIMIHFLRFR